MPVQRSTTSTPPTPNRSSSQAAKVTTHPGEDETEHRKDQGTEAGGNRHRSTGQTSDCATISRAAMGRSASGSSKRKPGMISVSSANKTACVMTTPRARQIRFQINSTKLSLLLGRRPIEIDDIEPHARGGNVPLPGQGDGKTAGREGGVGGDPRHPRERRHPAARAEGRGMPTSPRRRARPCQSRSGAMPRIPSMIPEKSDPPPPWETKSA